jgi:hypothetical protein
MSGAVVIIGAVGMSAVAGASGNTSTTTQGGAPSTTTSAPLTLAEWKTQYEPAIGQIADDALVAYDTGKKICQQWYHDATTLPHEVPAIPSVAVEKNWQGLVSASVSASSNCLAALQRGSEPAAKKFVKQLVLADDRERVLVKELGGTAQ